ncbi:deoxyribose-phosphate aldolase [Aliidiomarina halalkaliphila]|uniref:Deoxyribose-phosphate aldolase n=2 Tax=Aliidiomarina halalkaliphila TaxID=2593535 RepID=A0A552X376_9GAMM|nr:deoxyribose-phosphate aldolase [Aliidiomarina halalkaliphila]
MTRQQQARLAFSLLDLTSLTDIETSADIEDLCAKAEWRDADGNTIHAAALCIFPRFLPLARRILDDKGLYHVRLATVTNFPHGGSDINIAVKETLASVAYGADEVDVVLPYKALISGDTDTPLRLVQACKAACGNGVFLKVILETGELSTPELIAQASAIAIAGGADFIKTSTGKVTTNATPEAADIMLRAIAEHRAKGTNQAAPVRPVGFKPAGGIRTLEDAMTYIKAVQSTLGPDAVQPSLLRLGASSVRTNLVSVLEGTDEVTQSGGY